MSEAKEQPKCITVDDQVKSMTTMAALHADAHRAEPNNKICLCDGKPACFGKYFSYGALDCKTVCVHTEDCKKQKVDPNKDVILEDIVAGPSDAPNTVFEIKPGPSKADIEPPPSPMDPNKKILVLHLLNRFGKRYTCRSVEELEAYIDNVKAERKRKSAKPIKVRDEDVDIQIGFGRMTQAAYNALPDGNTPPNCKYFTKT